MRNTPCQPLRRGASILELLIVVGILVALIAIVGSAITGTGGTTGTEGAKDRLERQVQQLNLHGIYLGFHTFASSNNGKFPSTKTHGGIMRSDTTHEVFATLIDDGSLLPPQLVSDNEMDTAITVGSPNSFGVNNTSYALPDYDADNWLRYRHWNDTAGYQFALMSDRWYEDRVVEEYHSINGDWWHVLMGDGSTKIARNSPTKPDSSDDLFRRDSSLGALDALMVHD